MIISKNFLSLDGDSDGDGGGDGGGDDDKN